MLAPKSQERYFARISQSLLIQHATRKKTPATTRHSARRNISTLLAPARFGGDEFAVILADTAGEHVIPLAERFLDKVREIAIESNDVIINITCALGFTVMLAEDTVETFADRANKALFQVKANGRDQSAYILSANE